MPTAASQSAGYLLASQNPDGGWSYRPGGGSWTEPTCLALIALRTTPGPHTRRALDWLKSQRRSDGGWGPRPGVAESTWVTALGLLAMYSAGLASRNDEALRWLTTHAGAESSWVARLRATLLGSGGVDTSNQGWPWYPGASAWVAPTSMALLALSRLRPDSAVPDMGLRLEEGRRFLLTRRCADGGWNQGSTRALGYDGPSYPETTGLALLALGGGAAVPRQSIDKAMEHLNRCRSMEAWSWLQMGLKAQKVGWPLRAAPPWVHDLRDASLYLLAESALTGRDPFGKE